MTNERPEWLRLLTVAGLAIYVCLLLIVFYLYVKLYGTLRGLYSWIKQ